MILLRPIIKDLSNKQKNCSMRVLEMLVLDTLRIAMMCKPKIKKLALYFGCSEDRSVILNYTGRLELGRVSGT